ncbi:MAG TPA: hypothetical protein VNM90_30380 [Haliangium sp.]|nr:hypothetical protein [Haliangium sp.]
MTVLLEFFAETWYQEKDSFTKGFLTMKRLDSKTVAQSRKPLVLKRETLRRLEAGELEHAAGGVVTMNYTCACTKQADGQP